MIRTAAGEPRSFLDLTDREAYAMGALRISQFTNFLTNSPLFFWFELSSNGTIRSAISFSVIGVSKWFLQDYPPWIVFDIALKYGKFCFSAQKFTSTESYDIPCKDFMPVAIGGVFAGVAYYYWSLGSALYLARQVGIERPIGGCLSVALKRQAVAVQRCFTHCQRMNEPRRINACWRAAQEALSACLGRVWGRISRWF